MRGKDFYNMLQAEIVELEREVSGLNVSSDKIDKKLAELLERREAALSRLAKSYLPQLDAQSVKASLSDVQLNLAQLLEEKQANQRELAARISSLSGLRENLSSKHEELTDALEQITSKRDSLQESADKLLEQDSDYVSLREEVNQSTQQLAQHMRRVEELEREAREKLPEFDAEPLFTYLVKNNYGTKNYHSSWFTKALDRWVAKLVDFSSSKRHYDFLRSTPELVKIEVGRRQEGLEKLLVKSSSYERKIFDEVGLSEVLTQGQTIGAERDENITQLQQLNENQAQLIAESNSLRSSNGSFYSSALAMVKQFLGDQHITKLRTVAQERPGTEDDNIVSLLAGIDESLSSIEASGEEISIKLELADQACIVLRNLESRFLRNDFESERSFFADDFNPNEMFLAVCRKELSTDQAWRSIRAAQKFVRPQIKRYSSAFYQPGVAEVLGHVLAGAARGVASSSGPGYYRPGRNSGGSPVFRGARRRDGSFSSGNGF